MDIDFTDRLTALDVEAYDAEPSRSCATCGEPEGSVYAKHCCTDDNMIEA